MIDKWRNVNFWLNSRHLYVSPDYPSLTYISQNWAGEQGNTGAQGHRGTRAQGQGYTLLLLRSCVESPIPSYPRYLRKSEKRLKLWQKRLSKKAKGGKNREKVRQKLAKQHLRISRQRKDWLVKLASALVQSHDLIVYEDLQIKNLVKNHCLAKSINECLQRTGFWFVVGALALLARSVLTTDLERT